MPAAFTLVQWDKVGSCLHDIKERTTFDKNANHRVHYQSGLISWYYSEKLLPFGECRTPNGDFVFSDYEIYCVWIVWYE